MRLMIVYEGKYDYYDTYKKLAESPEVATLDQTQKGLIHTIFEGFKNHVFISATGKVQVYCSGLATKKQLHSILERYLGNLKPVKISWTTKFAQLVSKFPLPERITFSACPKHYRYELSEYNPFASARTPWSEQLSEYRPVIISYLFGVIGLSALAVIASLLT